jgi:hypothetical protein
LLKEPEFCQLFKPKKGTKKFVLQSIEKDWSNWYFWEEQSFVALQEGA